jgi:hypothetical protein
MFEQIQLELVALHIEVIFNGEGITQQIGPHEIILVGNMTGVVHNKMIYGEMKQINHFEQI